MARRPSKSVPRSTYTAPEPTTKDQDEAGAEGDEGESAKILNEAIQGSRKRRGLHKSQPVSSTRQSGASSQPPRSSARLGNLAALKKAAPMPDPYEIPDDEPGTDERNDMGDEADKPSLKRVKLSRMTPRPTKKPTPTGSNLEQQLDSLTGNGQLKTKRGRGRPKIVKGEPASTNDVPNAEVAVDRQDVVDSEDIVYFNTEEQDLPSSRDHSPTIMSARHTSDDGTGSNVLYDPQKPYDGSNVGHISLTRYTTLLNLLKLERAIPEKINNEQSKEKSKSGKDVEALNKEVIYITESYFALRTARTNGRAEDIQELQIEVTESTKIITTLVTRLKLEARKILTEVYLEIMPNFIKAINTGVKAYSDNEMISMAAIGEIANLLDIVYNLAYNAISQPVDLQPTAANGVYYIRGPTVTMLPIINEVREAFSAEVRKTLEDQGRAELKIIAAERKREDQRIKKRERERKKMERERKEREQEEEKRERQERQEREQERKRQEEAIKFSERRSAMNKLHRRQRQALDAKLADPLLAEWTRRVVHGGQTTSDGWRNETISKSRPSDTLRFTHPLSTLDYDEPGQNHRRSSDDHNERKMASNKREEHGPTRWSYEEKITFIDTMRSERGEDRYAKAAENLGWSMDDVFECAKDLQQAMDMEHERGNMNQLCDEWTYDIWVEQE